MNQSLWITSEPYPTTPEVLATAVAAGAEMVLHGIPPRLADQIAPGTLGLVTIALPDPPVEDFTDPVQVLLAELPAATLEEANDVLAQILDIIGGN
jgi:hypothetical protein